MLEYLGVTSTNFTNADGEQTEVKFRYVWNAKLPTREVAPNGRDIDHIAFQELGTEAEALRVIEYNATALSEYDFDMSKIRKLKIPIK